jgi:type VI secretion system secreted protein Hcp
MLRRVLVAAGVIATLLGARSAMAADTVSLFLKVKGTVIQGESSQPGREGSIDCLFYEQSGQVDARSGTAAGMGTGRRVYEPIKILKRVDKTSPLLMKALAEGAVLEAEFRFFRTRVDGREEPYYSVKVMQARVLSLKQSSPNLTQATAPTQPSVEEVTFQYRDISWHFGAPGASGSVSFQDKDSGAK